MTITYSLKIGNKLNKEQSNHVQQIIINTFEEVNAIYNIWNPESELSKINQLAAHQKIAISAELEKLLVLTDQIVHLTEGKFDPTIAPLHSLWKTKLMHGLTPSEEEIHSTALAVGWNKIHFHEGFFWKEKSETSLDLGGIAKGYAVDLLIERLQEAGYQNILVEWGGEIGASGQHPGRFWTIYIKNHCNQAAARVELNDQAIATSGDYMQNWTINAENKSITYFHIVNPATHYPLEINSTSIASASVLAETCSFADGLATAAMMFETRDAVEEWVAKIKKQYPAIKIWLFTREGD